MISETEFETIKKSIIEQIKDIDYTYTIDFNDATSSNGHGERELRHDRESLLETIEDILLRFK